MQKNQKTILITGCSSGIGLCAATELQKKGYRVFATTRNAADVKQLRDSGLESLVLDINDSESIRQALAEILQKTGGTLDALFNNAGFVQAGAVEDLSREMMRAQFETNLFGPMELANLVIPIMRKQGHGRIIQNGSLLGIVTMPYRGAYNASKFALEGFSHTLRQELRGTSIYVSIIVPGPIESQLRENAYKNYQENLYQKPSVYADIYKNMESYFFAPQKGTRRWTLSPETIVAPLLHALESPSPRAHYYIGLPAYAFALLRRLLPDGVLDWVVERVVRSEAR
jgi:NAD(P)-dependent dehydrogenase (short-subunit alcohol dehydrogenase family)